MIKNAGPLRLWAGRLCGLLADGLGGVVGGWRMIAFLGSRRGKEGGPAAGVGGAVGGVQGSGAMGCRGWMGRAIIRRQFCCI